jgi:hypothetical protein
MTASTTIDDPTRLRVKSLSRSSGLSGLFSSWSWVLFNQTNKINLSNQPVLTGFAANRHE